MDNSNNNSTPEPDISHTLSQPINHDIRSIITTYYPGGVEAFLKWYRHHFDANDYDNTNTSTSQFEPMLQQQIIRKNIISKQQTLVPLPDPPEFINGFSLPGETAKMLAYDSSFYTHNTDKTATPPKDGVKTIHNVTTDVDNGGHAQVLAPDTTKDSIRRILYRVPVITNNGEVIPKTTSQHFFEIIVQVVVLLCEIIFSLITSYVVFKVWATSNTPMFAKILIIMTLFATWLICSSIIWARAVDI